MIEIFFIILLFILLFISVKPLEEYPDSHLLVLNDESSTIDGIILNSTIINGVSYSNSIISIKSAGTYILSGLWQDKFLSRLVVKIKLHWF